MAKAQLRDRVKGAGVDLAYSFRHLIEALRIGDMRRVLSAYLGFTIAEMANFIAILIYSYEVGGPSALGLVAFLQLAPAAVFAPIGATLGDRFRREVMLAVAYASNVGGIGTKIGTGTNSIFAGFASEQLGVDIDFLRFFFFAFPFVVLFVPLLWVALWHVGARDAPRGEHGRAVLEQELRSLGPMSAKERTVAIVFGAAATLWICGDLILRIVAPHAQEVLGWKPQGKHVEAAVGMLALTSLLLLRALSLKGLLGLPYATLLLLGGSFAMADGISGSGLADWLEAELAFVATLSRFEQLLLACSATVFLSAIASNTATINLMLGVLPRSLPLLASCTIAASCDFALPAGTPPNAIVFGSGYIRLPTMMRIGFLLDCAAALVIAIYGYLYIPLILAP